MKQQNVSHKKSYIEKAIMWNILVTNFVLYSIFRVNNKKKLKLYAREKSHNIAGIVGFI